MNALSCRNLSLSLTYVLILHTPLFAQATHFVDSLSQNPVSPYLTRAKAAQTIQAALAVANNGDTINVQGGDTRLYHGPINVNKNVIIQPTPPENGGGGEPPVGGGGRSPCCSVHVVGDGGSPVIRCVNRASPMTLRGLDVYGGGGNQGGGIFVQKCSNILIDCCCVHSNPVEVAGGGIYVFRSTRVTINDCDIYSNSAFSPAGTPGRGGGLYVEQSAVGSVIDTRIHNNIALKAGGGAYVLDSFFWALTRCTFEDNYVNPAPGSPDGGYGGGLACRGRAAPTIVRLVDTDFFSNVVEPGVGGALALMGASEQTAAAADDAVGGVLFNMTGGSFVSNETQNGWAPPASDWIKRRGGAAFVKGILTGSRFDNVSFRGNAAAEDGGGLYTVSLAYSHLTLCTLAHNRADDDGGAVEVTGIGAGKFTSCSFTEGNTCVQDGGAIHVTTRASVRLLGETTIDHSIAGVNGGAVAARNSELTIQGGPTTITNNHAAGSGGGVHAFITDDSREGNSVKQTIYNLIINWDMIVRINRNVTFEDNTCGGVGGAIAIWRREKKYETSWKLAFALRGQCRFAHNRASSADENGVLPCGISVRDEYPDGDFECLVSGSRFQDHLAAGDEATPAATISFFAAAGGTRSRSPLEVRSVFEGIANFGLVAQRASLKLRDSVIANNTRTALRTLLCEGTCGISHLSASGLTNVELAGSAVSLHHCQIDGFGTTPTGILAGSTSMDSSANYCNIMHHTFRGVSVPWAGSSDPMFDATDNWWGNASGPNDPFPEDGTTHAGTGDTVSLGVDYEDWLSDPETIIPSVLTH